MIVSLLLKIEIPPLLSRIRESPVGMGGGGEGGRREGGSWVNFRWVCAAGLSERLSLYRLFYGQL